VTYPGSANDVQKTWLSFLFRSYRPPALFGLGKIVPQCLRPTPPDVHLLFIFPPKNSFSIPSLPFAAVAMLEIYLLIRTPRPPSLDPFGHTNKPPAQIKTVVFEKHLLWAPLGCPPQIPVPHLTKSFLVSLRGFFGRTGGGMP